MSGRYGNCNFRNLQFNTVCGCQEFLADEEEDVSTLTGPNSSGGRARKNCLCGHFVNFHTKPTSEEPTAPRRQLLAESFRSARARSQSRATSATSIAPTTTGKPTPATEAVHDPEDEEGEGYTLSKTFEDSVGFQHAQHEANRLAINWPKPSFGDRGLGINTARLARDFDRNNGGRSGDSSAVTEIAPGLNFMANRLQAGQPPLRSTRSSPLLGYQQFQQNNYSHNRIADDMTNASTIADPPMVTGEQGYVEMYRRAEGALRFVRDVSHTFLPIHLRDTVRIDLPGGGETQDKPPLVVFDGTSHDDIQRQSLVTEQQIKTLMGTIVARMHRNNEGEEPKNRIEELPQSIPPETPMPPRNTQHAKSSPDKPASNEGPVPSSPPVAIGQEVAIVDEGSEKSVARAGVTESFVTKKITEQANKVDQIEDMYHDVLKAKNDIEGQVEEMENCQFNQEERIHGLEQRLQQFEDAMHNESFRRKPRDEDEEDDDFDEEDLDSRKKKSRRSKKRRHEQISSDTRTPSSVERYTKKVARDSEVNKMPDGTIKQTLTTTTSVIHSTSTSFASTSSCSISTRQKQTATITLLTNQVGHLNAKLHFLESRVPPTVEHPWTVQVVVIPQSTWLTWKKSGGELAEYTKAPRILDEPGRAWKRLKSRCLIKTIQISGGEFRDVDRAMRRAFGDIFKILSDRSDTPEDNYQFCWTPLRKVPNQCNLRFLHPDEMNRQFFKVDFLRGTCCEELKSALHTPPPSSDPPSVSRRTSQVTTSKPSPPRSSASPANPKPSHRLYITNFWTSEMNGSQWDTTAENTQASSIANPRPPAIPRIGSNLSTQPSSVGGTIPRRRGDHPVSPGLNLDTQRGWRSGWTDIRNLPPESLYFQESKNETWNAKPRSIEDEPFWLYDYLLDGPVTGRTRSVEGSAPPPDHTVYRGDQTDELQAVNASFRRTSLSQRSQKITTQQSNPNSKTSFTQHPSLFSPPSLYGINVPQLSRKGSRNLVEGEAAPMGSFAALSHDSDSTPKARSFLTTPPPMPPAATAPSRILRSHHTRGPKKVTREDNALVVGSQRQRSSQAPLSRKRSKESQISHDDSASVSRATTVEVNPVSMQSNLSRTALTKAEFLDKYLDGNPDLTLRRYLDQQSAMAYSRPTLRAEPSGLKG